MGIMDIHSLSHTKWNCKYHIAFTLKYRRKLFYYKKRKAIGEILKKLFECKKGEYIKGRSISRLCAYTGKDTA